MVVAGIRGNIVRRSHSLPDQKTVIGWCMKIVSSDIAKGWGHIADGHVIWKDNVPEGKSYFTCNTPAAITYVYNTLQSKTKRVLYKADAQFPNRALVVRNYNEVIGKGANGVDCKWCLVCIGLGNGNEKTPVVFTAHPATDAFINGLVVLG